MRGENCCHFLSSVFSSIPGSGRSPGEGNGNPPKYSCLDNPMGRGAWWATVHGVARVRHDLATKTKKLTKPFASSLYLHVLIGKWR